MALWRVTDRGVKAAQMLAWEDESEARIYSFVPNFGDFRFNPGLTTDFRFDHDYVWETLTVDQAQEMMRAKVGWIRECIAPDVWADFSRAAAVSTSTALTPTPE